jgi:hypothetical protein
MTKMMKDYTPYLYIPARDSLFNGDVQPSRRQHWMLGVKVTGKSGFEIVLWARTGSSVFLRFSTWVLLELNFPLLAELKRNMMYQIGVNAEAPPVMCTTGCWIDHVAAAAFAAASFPNSTSAISTCFATI